MKEDATTPNVTFKYSVSVPNADVPGSTSTIGVFKGVTATEDSVDYPKVADVSYSSTDTADETAPVTLPTGYKSVTKDITMDFSNIKFPEPGVYRYYITEQDNDIPGMKYDVTAEDEEHLTIENSRIRTLDIYVEDIKADSEAGNSGSVAEGLKITGYVLYKNQVTGCPLIGSNATSGTAIESPVTINANGIFVASGTATGATMVANQTKTNNIINFYATNNLTFGKEVTGNQGSRDKYFKFTVTAGEASVKGADEFIVDMTKATKEPSKTAATVYTANDMADANNVTKVNGAELLEGKDFYLQDGDYITIQGLPQGFVYTVAEVNEDYTKTEKIAETVSSLDWNADHEGVDALNDALTGTINNADIHTGFTNSKEGVIPTGVLLTMAPVIVVGVVVIAGLAFFAVRSAKRKATEAAEADADSEE